MMLMFLVLAVVSSFIPFNEGMVRGDPCYPNPCGQNTQCNTVNSRPVCSCLPGHFGNPLSYCQRGECQDNYDCGPSQACRDYKCVNVCAGQCGSNADCNVRNHIPVCSCPPQHTGDPLVNCRRVDPEEQCHPSPCGQNTKCEVINNVPICTCLPGYLGSPLSGCRHECESDYECSASQSCQNYLCVSVCKSGTCGIGAQCESVNHRAICSCPKGYLGDPYTSCRAECQTHHDCPSDRPSCLGEKCINPCQPGVCGIGANCEVRGATPICSCPRDMTGDPFVRCRPFEPADLCEPNNPCGENAKCTPGHDNTGKERPVCTCLPGYVGNALTVCRRGECQTDLECRHDQVCLNYECRSACSGQCGVDAICNAKNHVATCSCPPGYSGNAIARCYQDSPSGRRSGRYYHYNYRKREAPVNVTEENKSTEKNEKEAVMQPEMKVQEKEVKPVDEKVQKDESRVGEVMKEVKTVEDVKKEEKVDEIPSTSTEAAKAA